MLENYRFSWRRLPEALRGVLADEAGLKPNAGDAVWSAKLGDEPGRELLGGQWVRLRDEWLYGDLPNARSLSRALMSRGLGYPDRYGRSREDVYAYLCSCRFGPQLADELAALLWSLGGVRVYAKGSNANKDDTPIETTADDGRAYAGLRRWAVPDDGSRNRFRPYEHQEAAWKALDEAMRVRSIRTDRGLRALLVLPTGAGKTSTATRWLNQRYLRPGASRPVLWIAHRAELLEQAARSFGDHVDATGRTRIDPLDVQCLSTQHGRGADAMLDAEVEVTCASIFTLVAGDNEHIVEQYLLRHPDAFIVIDEAHHAAARSYRWLLAAADRHPGVDVLGLTATPARTAEREQGWIARLFPDGVVYETDLAGLIAKGVLARPMMEDVDTGEEVVLSPEERAYLKRFSDYAPKTLERLANSVGRNKAIVDHYLADADRFGQTLVFATSVAHAMLLAGRFNEAGVAADYVTYVAEPGHPRADELLDAFKKSKLQVLTSVTKLTEGVDLPNAKTIFLARPTRSEILLKQMVGRALRGPAAGGTDEAHLVSFVDQWEEFADWLSPRGLFPAADIVDAPLGAPPERVLVEIPWDLLRELAHQIHDRDFGSATMLVPAGWYDLSLFAGEKDDAPLRQVLVYDHQRDGFDALLEAARDLGEVPAGDMADGFFDGVPEPLPSSAAREAVARYRVEFDRDPPFVEFAQRDRYLPQLVAARIVKDGVLDDIAYAGDIWDQTQARDVFSDRGAYIRAVRRHVEDLKIDGGGLDEWVPADLFAELKKPLEPGDWDLEALVDEVREQMILTRPAPLIGWSARRIRHYWGQYDSRSTRITINCVLRTRSISKEAMKLLIYHELLHHELGVEIGHRGDFREREHRYPNWAERNAEMDGLQDYFLLDGS